MDFDTRYRKLNDHQREAVDHIDGPVMVVAGPGTGKTELLSMRVANILRQTDTLPENILCLTFTESGAAAMRERLAQIIGKDAYKVAIHTFHSFGTEVINQNGDFFYHGAHFRPADELSSYELLRGIFDELPYDSPLATKMNGEYTYLGDTLSVIGELKKSGLTSDELLAVLDANDAVLDAVEPQLSDIFAGRISKTTPALLGPLAETIASLPQPALPIGIVPLASALSLSIAHAFDAAQETDSTKPITAWRNTWLEKDTDGRFVFKDRRRHAKLRTASFIYYQYLARMQEAELFDFDDMILRVVHALEVFPDLRFNLQEKFQYIMVDEFQDTNLAQMRILYNLTNNEIYEGRPNIMVVGDDDQAIYSFQGADISNILEFEHAYRDVAVITLTDNYRSSAPILGAARQVIVQGGGRLETSLANIDKRLTPHHQPNATSVDLTEYATVSDERRAIVGAIAERIAAGEAPESIAVLARRHHELEKLLPYFEDAQIPVNYERQDNVLDIEPVRTLEAMARLIVALYESRHDEVEALLPEVMTHPAWGFGAQDIWKLSLGAHAAHTTWMEAMSTRPEFTAFQNWLVSLASEVPRLPLEQLVDHIFGNHEAQIAEEEVTEDGDEPAPAVPTFVSPLYQYYFSADKLAEDADEYLVYLEALRTLRSKLRDYQPGETPTLQTFVRFIDLHRELGSRIASLRPHASTRSGAVHLMTAHKSKGLEFDTVHVIGAIDSAWGERVRSRSRLIGYPENLPLAPSGDTLDERLRLFFVAMTRAKCHLAISYSLADDAGKPTLGASFLLGTDLQPVVITTTDTLQQTIRDAERRWYEPLIHLSHATMQDLLGPTLETYKLSVTHLNNFLDVTRGGPQAFLMGNLLRFPQAMSPHAAYGSAIHRTLQRAHAHLSATGEYRPIEDILHDFETNLHDLHLIDGDYDHFHQKGIDTLSAFLETKYDSFTPQQKVELNFAGQGTTIGAARLTGALDLVELDRTEQTMIVTDYKTGKASQSWAGKTDADKIKLHKYKQQLMFYKLLVEGSRDYHSYTVEKGVLQFVEPTPSGGIVSLDLSFDSEELLRFSRLIEVVWQHIMALDLPDTNHYDQTYKGMLAFEEALLADY